MKELCALANVAETHAKQWGVPKDIHLDDYIFQFLINNSSFNTYEETVRYFFDDGRECANKLASVLKNLGSRFCGPLSLLEFASGYGRVTRHLPIVMSHINFTACDIHEEAVRFISERIELKSVTSHKDPSSFVLPQHYDVIFSLSFFSHIARKTWGAWISAQFEKLNPGGALIFTTHGLESMKFFGDIQIPPDGFWFKADSEQSDLDKSEYGSTLVTKEFVEKEVFTQTKRPIEVYRPGFWWNHQDLYIVIK